MTVLIVDDQPDVVRGEQQGIDWEKLGIGRILTAYSVPEARELLLGERVDILLCDIEMPPHSGLELLSLIREQKLKELEDHLDAAVELAAQCGVSALELMEMLRILLKEEEPHV